MTVEMSMALMFALLIGLGVALLLLARWARRRNRELSVRHGKYLYAEFDDELRRGHVFEATRKAFLGTLERPVVLLGHFLTISVLVAVTGVFLLIAILLATK